LKLVQAGHRPADWALSALDPGKQGLKPTVILGIGRRGTLSALDPGKQGLKPIFACMTGNPQPIFQRLIQENKD